MPILLSEAFTAMLTMITGATFYALLITNAVASKVSSQCSRQLYDDKVRETGRDFKKGEKTFIFEKHFPLGEPFLDFLKPVLGNQ